MNEQSCNGGPGGETARRAADHQALEERMGLIDEKLLVLSGKGGVGKSTVAANLALTLAREGRRVGLLDVDLHGPSIPKLLGLEGRRVHEHDGALRPVHGPAGVQVVSVGFLMPSENDALVWRGPRKYALIRQFLTQVAWGALDYLVIDAPPGTGDEPMAVAEMARPNAAAILVTTPQALATADVRRSVAFCRLLELRILGIIENMSGLVCPDCGRTLDLFGTGGGRQLATSMALPFLGAIPIDPEIVIRGDRGQPLMETAAGDPSSRAFADLAERILFTRGMAATPTADLLGEGAEGHQPPAPATDPSDHDPEPDHAP